MHQDKKALGTSTVPRAGKDERFHAVSWSFFTLGEKKFHEIRRKDARDLKPYSHTARGASQPTTQYRGIYFTLGEKKFHETRRKDARDLKPYSHTAIGASQPTTQYRGIYFTLGEKKFHETRRKDARDLKPYSHTVRGASQPTTQYHGIYSTERTTLPTFCPLAKISWAASASVMGRTL